MDAAPWPWPRPAPPATPRGTRPGPAGRLSGSCRPGPRRPVPYMARRRSAPRTGRPRAPRQRGRVRCRAPRARQDPEETA
ncbi:hypothetical protein ADK51_19110 [Streptomyces sp. WM6368]|nr:hypothetical protein ADK51_19110 [Streptomyces sp. WM6368]